MFIGIILIICGILIALYPPLLSMIVAALLVIMGIFVLMLAHSFKKAAKSFNDPILDLFMRM